MRRKRFEYQGGEYTFDELCEMLPDMKPSILQTRLHKGMTVEEAIRPQTYEELVPEKYRYKDLVVCFDVSLPVFPHMQPVLKKQYLAVPNVVNKHGRMFYTVNVRGNKLIVYPDEFRILGVAKRIPSPEQVHRPMCASA